MKNLIRKFFFNVIVRFVVYVLMGVNIRNRHNLPKQGPAILVANHNSHLDAMVLMTIMPMKLLPKIKPLAACDYFLCNRFMTWFSTHIVNIIPIKRCHSHQSKTDTLSACYQELENGTILIIFPEGSRGEPEKMGKLKSGIARLAMKYPEIPVIPVYMSGMGRVLPRGSSLLVPFFCDVNVGEALPVCTDKNEFMEVLEASFKSLNVISFASPLVGEAATGRSPGAGEGFS